MTVQRPSTIVQAAAILGIKPEAVRGRLRRGTLRGERTATGWMVWLDDPAGVRPASVQPSTSEARGEFPHVSESSGQFAQIAERGDLVEQLRSEVAYLRGALEREQATNAETQAALERSQQGEAELRRLLQQRMPPQLAPVDVESAQVPAERAPESPEFGPVTAPSGDSPPARKRPWWRLW